MEPNSDHRQSSPAALRNRDPILDVLRRALPPSGRVVEIASGAGDHALYFARSLPHLAWQPSDPSPTARASIAAWREAEGPANLNPPLDLDASAERWPIDQADALVAINMVHISPWRATIGLCANAGRILPPGGLLFLYGPYRQQGRPLAPSNIAFDADLRRRNPEWGIRDVADVVAAAQASALRLEAVVAMPANNLSLLFRR